MNGGTVAAAYPLSKPPHDPLTTTQPLHIPAKRPTWPTAYPHVSNFFDGSDTDCSNILLLR